MAGELEHTSVGRALNRQEWENVATHRLDSQQPGDMVVATSATQLGRLPVGPERGRLHIVLGVPVWV